MTIATRFPKSWAIPKFDIKDPSLVLYLPLWYPYSDMAGSTIYSYDTNRHTGTLTGTTWGREGRTFDGNDYINCGTNSVLRPTDGHTLISWFNVANVDAAQFLVSVAYDTGGTWDAPYVGIALNILATNGRVSALWNIGGTYNDLSTNLSNNLNTWYQAAYTFDGTTHSIYQDGVFNVSEVDAGSVTYSGSPAFVVGVRSADALDEYLRNGGQIGEVLLYNRALSAGEIRRIYQGTRWRYI